MDLTWLAIPLAWFTLMGAPWVAIATAAWGRRRGLPLQRPCRRAAVLVAIVAAAWFAGIEFTWRPLSWLALAAAYIACALLVGAAFAIRPRWVGVGVGTIASATLAPGVLFGTVGLLALFFVAGDYASAPIEARTLAPGLDCVVTGWGAAFSDEGHDVQLYRYWPLFPLTRRQVRRVVVNETEPRPGIPKTTGCREVAGLATSSPARSPPAARADSRAR